MNYHSLWFLFLPILFYLILLFCLCASVFCLHVSLGTAGTLGTCRGQQRALEPLKLKLQI